MRLFFSILFILIIVGLAAPWVDGLILKQNYLNTLDAINQNQKVKLTLLQYRLGWMHSYAKLKVTPLDENKNPLTNFDFTIVNKITHGPIIFDRSTHKIYLGIGKVRSFFHLPQQAQLFLKEARNGVMQITTYAHLNGEWDNKIKIPMLQINIPAILQITWQGLTGDYVLTVKNRKIVATKTQLKAGNISINTSIPNAPINHFIIQGFTIDDHVAQLPNNLIQSKTNFVIPNLSFQMNNQTMSANHFVVNNQMGLNAANLYFIQNEILLSDFNLPGTFITKVSPVKIYSAIMNLDPNALQLLIKTASTMHNDDDSNALINLLPNLVTSTTQINQNIEINTSLGHFLSTLKIVWDETPKTTDALMNELNLSADIRASTALVDKVLNDYAPLFMPEAVSAPANVSDDQTNNVDNFNVTVANLLKEGKLNFQISMQLIEWRDQKINAAEFAADVDHLNIQTETKAKLKQAYQAQLSIDQNSSQNKIATVTIHPPSPTQIFKNWLQQGYIVINNHDYVLHATIVKSIVKLNGKSFNLQPAP